LQLFNCFVWEALVIVCVAIPVKVVFCVGFRDHG